MLPQKAAESEEEMEDYIGAIIIGAIVLILLIIIFISGYVKASTDEAFIITGLHKEPRYLIGRAGIKIPFFEKKDVLKLQLIPIDVKTSSAVPTADYINIMVDATVNVQIGHTPDLIKKASKNFLNKKPEYIAAVAREVLEGNVREIVGKMHLEEMVSDRQKFATLVKENADPDLEAMGLVITSFNVQNFVDDNHVIENLGVDNVVRIQKAAAISRAESERDIKIAQAQADKAANDEQVKSQTEIATKQNELAIKQSELKQEADTKQAVADAAYEIQKEEQRKTIEVTRANADIARQERETELKQREADVKEQVLNAEVRKKADAEKYRRQQEADANLIERQREADARKYEQEKAAEAIKAQADAAVYAKEKEAAGIAAVGRAEAEAIQAKGLAEAEAMEKKAEAYAKYNNAAITEMIIKQLPAIAKEVAAPIASIDKITVIDSGNGDSGVSSVGGYTPAVMAKVIQSVKETTGFDLMEVMKAQTYDAKVNKNINVTGLDAAVAKEVTKAAGEGQAE